MPSPYEVIAGAMPNVYVAPVGEAFPLINATPAGNWSSFGYTVGGVTVGNQQSIEDVKVDQSLMALKPYRTEAGANFTFDLASLTAENMAKVLNNATVTDTAPGAGTAGHRSFPVSYTAEVPMFAMLIKIPSAYGNWAGQFEIPKVAQVGEPEVAYAPDATSVLSTEWKAYENPSVPGNLYTFRVQDALPV